MRDFEPDYEQGNGDDGYEDDPGEGVSLLKERDEGSRNQEQSSDIVRITKNNELVISFRGLSSVKPSWRLFWGIWIVSAVVFFLLGRGHGTVEPPSKSIADTVPDPSKLQPAVTPHVAPDVPETPKEAESDEINPGDGEEDDDDGDEEENEPVDEDAFFKPHLPFGNELKQYRRVCAEVHSSILCLTLRFPFAFEPQDKHYEYPFPIDERMYGLDGAAYYIDGDDIRECQQSFSESSSSDQVRECLEHYVQDKPDSIVAGLWTKGPIGANVDELGMWGIEMSPEQGYHVDKHFDKHVVLVIGASPTPGVLSAMLRLWGGCEGGGIKPISALCSGHVHDDDRVLHETNYTDVSLLALYDMEREIGNKYTFASLPEDQTFVGVYSYYPTDKQHGRHHGIPEDIPSHMLSKPGFHRSKSAAKRKFSMIIDYPIAHAQNENMMFDEWDKIEAIQKGFPRNLMAIYSDEGRKVLADLGWEPGHIIAFDGTPQFNPTTTGGYNFDINWPKTEEGFFAPDYEGMAPPHGTKCIGPLPDSSIFKTINVMAEDAFRDEGLDMNFYGRTWEFTNQFWFQAKGWTSKGIDCTHAKGNGASGLANVQRYFLQSMLDDHYQSEDRV